MDKFNPDTHTASEFEAAVQAWFNSLSDEVQWNELNEFEQDGAREAFIDEQEA